MIDVRKHIELLGYRFRDRVTGLKGVATSVCIDLYGCAQVALDPGLDKNGHHISSQWYDSNRLQQISKKRVMEPPEVSFAADDPERTSFPIDSPPFVAPTLIKGPAEKPSKE